MIDTPRRQVRFYYKNCSICRLDCVERDTPNKDNLPLSLDTRKYRGQCKPSREQK